MPSFVQELEAAALCASTRERRVELTFAAATVAGWLHILAGEGSREALIGLNAAVAISWRILCEDPLYRG